jgi:hypothetical protein
VWYSLFKKSHLKKLGLGFVQVGLVWHCAKAVNARSPPAKVELQCQLKTTPMARLRTCSWILVNNVATRVALHAKTPLFAEGRTLALEEFKYALESRRQTLAFARFPVA